MGAVRGFSGAVQEQNTRHRQKTCVIIENEPLINLNKSDYPTSFSSYWSAPEYSGEGEVGAMEEWAGVVPGSSGDVQEQKIRHRRKTYMTQCETLVT